MFLVDWWLCVACYFPTTPTDYPSTTRDMSVSPPVAAVAVDIDFSGYLRFLSISFVWIIWVQYVTDRLSGQEREFVHRPVLIFQPTVNSRASDKQTSQCLEHISQLRQNTQLPCVDIQIIVCGGGTFWLHKESLTFNILQLSMPLQYNG